MSAPNMVHQFSDRNMPPHLHRNQTFGGGANGPFNNRSRELSRDRSHDRDYSRGRSGFNTPPHPERQSRFDMANALPLMNPAPQRSIEQRRLDVMAAQQRVNQVNYHRRQQQQQPPQQRGGQGRHSWQPQGYQGRR